MEFFKDKSSVRIISNLCKCMCDIVTILHLHKSLVIICRIFKSVGLMVHTYIFEAAMLQAN